MTSSRSTPAAPLLGRVRLHYRSTSTTMDRARDLARGGYPDGTVITTDLQTTGRGRLGRRWEAAAGDALLCTVLLYPSLMADHAPLLTVAAALAVAEVVDAIFPGTAATIKWPNDVLAATVRGLGKVAGILVETSLVGARVATAAIGIGLNVAAHPPDLPAATHLAELAGHTVDRRAVLDHLLVSLAGTLSLANDDPTSLMATFRGRSATLGQLVQVTDASGSYLALAQSIDGIGALLVEMDDGQWRRLVAGEVTLRA